MIETKLAQTKSETDTKFKMIINHGACLYDCVAWLKLKKEKVSYVESQVCFWSWLTIKGRNIRVISKIFGERNSVGEIQEIRMHFPTYKEILFL